MDSSLSLYSVFVFASLDSALLCYVFPFYGTWTQLQVLDRVMFRRVHLTPTSKDTRIWLKIHIVAVPFSGKTHVHGLPFYWMLSYSYYTLDTTRSVSQVSSVQHGTYNHLQKSWSREVRTRDSFRGWYVLGPEIENFKF